MPNSRYSALLAAALIVLHSAALRTLAAEPEARASTAAAEVRRPDARQADAQHAPAPSAPRCLEALVHPVSGHAECVNPRGAPVAQPRRASMDRDASSAAGAHP